MKSVPNKNSSPHEGIRLWLFRPSFILAFVAILIFTVYAALIRPLLKPMMTTVTVELVITFILIFSLLIVILIILVTLLNAFIKSIHKRTAVPVRYWLSNLRRRLSAAIIFAAILAAFTVYTQNTAYTPPILGNNGEKLEGSIAALEKVKLGGSEQWITIRGKNKDNPVLLFLAGGPGGSQLAATRTQLEKLEDYFVVVNWDQPGSGKSYNSLPLESITPERYISDAYQLTQYLSKRFNQQKIYVVGESWGSALGIWLVQHHPELFYAFIGTGQMVSFKDTEDYCYEKALEIAEEAGDIKKIEELREQGRPPYYGEDVAWKEAAYLNYLSSYMARNSHISNPGYNTLGDMAGPEYGLYDKVNYIRGIITTFGHVYQQLYDFDLREQAAKIDVPVYFIEGRHDINAPPAFAKDYYNKLSAPDKKFIWFEYSGHSPWINERDKFVDTLVSLTQHK